MFLYSFDYPCLTAVYLAAYFFIEYGATSEIHAVKLLFQFMRSDIKTLTNMMRKRDVSKPKKIKPSFGMNAWLN